VKRDEEKDGEEKKEGREKEKAPR
jgi:hypothetical protein